VKIAKYNNHYVTSPKLNGYIFHKCPCVPDSSCHLRTHHIMCHRRTYNRHIHTRTYDMHTSLTYTRHTRVIDVHTTCPASMYTHMRAHEIQLFNVWQPQIISSSSYWFRCLFLHFRVTKTLLVYLTTLTTSLL